MKRKLYAIAIVIFSMAMIFGSVTTFAEEDTLLKEETTLLLGEDQESLELVDTVELEIPEQPEGLTASSVDGGIKISWNDSENAVKYNLYWKTEGRNWAKFASTTSTSFVDTAIDNGTKYYYSVSAVNEAGESGFNKTGVYAVGLPSTLINAQIASNGITLSWKQVNGATGYRLYWRIPGGTWKSFKDVEGALTYLDKGVTFGETYEYLARPYKTIGGVKYCGSWTAEKADRITYVATPKLKEASSTKDGIKIFWEEVEGAAGYYVYWKTQDGSWKRFAQTTDTFYVDKAVSKGQVYYYTVKAFSAEGKGSWHDSKGIIGTFVGNTEFVSAVNKADNITLSWKAVSGVTGYRLYWRYPGGTWRSFKDVESTTSYCDKGVSYGKTYEYLVRPYITVNGSKCLGGFDAASTVKVERMVVPTMKKTSSTKDGIRIEWDEVENAVKYKLYWRTEGGSWKQLAETAETYFVDKEVSTGSKYYYTVIAVNANGNGSWYEYPGIAGVYVPGTKITDATNEENGILLKWNKVSGVTGYRLYWRIPGGTWRSFVDVEGSTQYSDSAVNSNTVYEYLARPYKTINGVKYLGYFENGFGKSCLRIGTPELISCKNVKNPNGIKISWKPVAGASKYNLYWKPLNGTNWKKLDTVTDTEYVDTNITEGGEYCYTVSATIETEEGEVTGAYNSCGISNSLISNWTMKRLNEAGGTLRGAYDWAVRIPYDGLQPSSSTSAGYALYSFQNQSGDCLGKAATFYYMAKALGYDVKMIQGYVPLRAGGMGIHGWVELVDKNTGITYFCDPDFETETGYDGYLRQYRQPGTWRYTDYKELK